MKILTDFRKTVKTGVDPRLLMLIRFLAQIQNSSPKQSIEGRKQEHGFKH